jgi:demethylmenaquinone methyltransferase/2-methoxy-6-polyprenyl-1,4-benzoquinol methylase
MPEPYPDGSTCWRRLQLWEEQDVWLDIWRAFLGTLDQRKRLDWHEAFADGSFECVTIAFGLRNVTDIDKALNEAWRVLKPGGRFYCLEFSKVTSAPMARVYDAYSERALPFFGRVVARDAESYRYLHESIRRFPPQRELADRMRRAEFAKVDWRNMTLGVVALHSGWRI